MWYTNSPLAAGKEIYNSLTDKREKCMFGLMVVTGLRANEVALAKLDNIKLYNGEVVLFVKCKKLVVDIAKIEINGIRAEKERLELITTMDMVMTIENLLVAKGFTDAVVSTSSGNISVIVESAGLTSAEVAQIVDVVKNNSGYSMDNIKIIEA